MKKFIILGIISLTIAVAVSFIPLIAENMLPTVATQTPIKIPYHETVYASGSIGYKEQNNISTSIPVVIEQVTVNEGDFVNIGQIIAYVNKEATLTMLSGLSKYNLSELGADNLSAAAEMIPKEIEASHKGIVIYKANNGEIVQSQQPILTLSNSDELIANLSIKESDISKIQIGQRVDLSGAAFEKNTYYGYISKISSSARKNYSGTVSETVVDVQVSIKNPDKNLRSGYNTEASISTEIPRDIYVLPYDLINQDEEGEYVFVVSNGAAIKRYIETGIELEEGAQILKGVAPDERVVKNPEQINKNTAIKLFSADSKDSITDN
ncbi:MAG: HlyD family efflux transporter periplasmic adaptor subunit [Clostridiales bacterium]|mgnify:CR=1 FL=1|nr:HlyD family efflux transporter periplasmic adaptor subunit [Clostridiales bacterium]